MFVLFLSNIFIVLLWFVLFELLIFILFFIVLFLVVNIIGDKLRCLFNEFILILNGIKLSRILKLWNKDIIWIGLKFFYFFVIYFFNWFFENKWSKFKELL